MSTPYHLAIVDAFEDELQKIAAAKLKKDHMKTLGVAAAGAVGYEGLRRANQDRKMGRMVRIQQNQGY